MAEDTKIGIIGIGMVGAPLARYLEEHKGYQRRAGLFLFDINTQKGFSDNIGSADVVFISVPTPRQPDGSTDLTAVKSALTSVPGGKIVVIKSTVAPGTTENLQCKFTQHKILFNPEFLTEKNAWENTLKPDRQLVGWTEASKNVAPLVLSLLPKAPLASPSSEINMTATEAELVKHGANLFLTRKVTFANAMYDLASFHGVNYERVKMGIGADPRIGLSHLDVNYQGYRGYGGYCFTKDTDAIIHHCRVVGARRSADLFEADRKFNEAVLSEQGLTPEDVSVHDLEWVQRKMKGLLPNTLS